ncbi:unnamed protein product [Rhizoctonia solani]|uniref:Uncharacterized protein n=1 Tax=Rhizoctonia solani TaxID=456999 RepID=A0A8H3CSW3_9AGAM|nr:unnamed protein product [Rhizoctonia solani]
MSTPIDEHSTSAVDESKLEQGVKVTETPSQPEPTFTWSNPGPLFKSSRRVIIFSLVVWMIFVTLEYVFGLNATTYSNWSVSKIVPMSNPITMPRTPQFKVCCIDGFKLMLDPRRDPPAPESCGLCIYGPYRTLYESGTTH